MICSICNKNFEKLKTKTPARCNKCWNKWREESRSVEICIICNRKMRVKKRIEAGPLCGGCYSKEYRKTYQYPLGICYYCKQEKPITYNSDQKSCKACYSREVQPKQICSQCGRLKSIRKIDKKRKLCGACYSTPKELCIKCGTLSFVYKRIDNGPICHSCYVPPNSICSNCKLNKPISSRKLNLCKICYENWKMKNDIKFRVKKLLRTRFRSAMEQFTKTGKVKTSKHYGIDYNKIFKHLGNCPGNIEDYHIDHIIPLCAFDLENIVEIKAAMAPENHQWLLANKNLSKNGNYDMSEYKQYIKQFKEKHNE